MATLPPRLRCFICDQPLEYYAVPRPRRSWEPLVMGPTDWRQKPHTCPPGAVEAWREKLGIVVPEK